MLLFIKLLISISLKIKLVCQKGRIIERLRPGQIGFKTSIEIGQVLWHFWVIQVVALGWSWSLVNPSSLFLFPLHTSRYFTCRQLYMIQVLLKCHQNVVDHGQYVVTLNLSPKTLHLEKLSPKYIQVNVDCPNAICWWSERNRLTLGQSSRTWKNRL